METLRRARTFARVHPYGADGLLALALYLATVLAPVAHHPGKAWSDFDPSEVLSVAGFVVYLPLVWRRRHPVVVAAATVTATLGYMVVGPVRGPILLGAGLAVYTVCSVVDRRLALAIGGVCVLTLGITSMALSPEPWDRTVNAVAFAWIAVAVAVGEAVRSRRAFVAAIEERARRAEHTREEEARRRVAEERLRIARELHDIVGHHIALINIQAGVASHVLDSRPDAAREALAQVREAGRSALAELGATVAVLRRGDEEDERPPHEPMPGLDGLPELLESFRRSGLTVDQRVGGVPRDIPAAVDLTAYRVVQESLTNVRKHAGSAAARLRLDYRADRLRVEVEDDGPADPGGQPGEGSGYGIIGMRERAASVGGSFRAGHRAGGGFRVAVELPYALAAGGRR